jgi:hypothetical protein
VELEKLKNTLIGLKARELKHRLTFKKSYIHMAQGIQRYKKCKEKNPCVR